jgi:hypothetical protein
MTDTLSRMETSPIGLMLHDEGDAVAAGGATVTPATAKTSHQPAGVERAAGPILEPADLVPENVIEDMVAAGHGAALEPVVLPKARIGMDLPDGLHEPVWPTIEEITAITDDQERALVVKLNLSELIKNDNAGPLFESVRGVSWDGDIAWAGWLARHNPSVVKPPLKRRPRPKPLPKFVSADFLEMLLGEDAPAYLAALEAKYAAKKGGQKLVVFRNTEAAK